MGEVTTEDHDPGHTPSPFPERVWGTLRLTCDCWWSWKANEQADYIFPRDEFECRNVDEDGLEHGPQTVVTVRMHPHHSYKEKMLLRRFKLRASPEYLTSKEERRIEHEAQLARQREETEERLAGFVAALARGESPEIGRKDRKRLRAAGMNV